MSELQYLFSPIKIRSKVCQSRVVFTAHLMVLHSRPWGEWTYPSDEGKKLLEYHRARASRGLGLAIIGGFNDRMPEDDNAIDQNRVRFEQLGDVYHEQGVTAVLQTTVWARDPVRGLPDPGVTGRRGGSFSAVPWRQGVYDPNHKMDESEIEDTMAHPARVAKLAEEAGLDGIEIHAAHGSLPQQSWTKLYNQRTDKWGEKFTFVDEIIRRIRAVTGDDFIIGLRMPFDDFVPIEIGGIGPQGAIEIAKHYDGIVDYFNMTEGQDGGYYSAPMWFPPGVWVAGHAEVKKAVEKAPVIGTCRINDPIQAEKILADGLVDMVGMTRALIADNEMTTKAKEEKVEEIRHCIACNQGCYDPIMVGVESRCLQNPLQGLEYIYGSKIKPAEQRKKVIVIGGGPAGLEAARVCAERGHEVVLYEKQAELGGQINILTKVPARQDFVEVVSWRTNEFKRLGVKVELGVEATPDMILASHPDMVIVATGSVPTPPPATGMDQDNVLSVWDVLLETKPVGQNVLVFDTDGKHKGMSVAEFIADRGRSVELITPYMQPGQFLGNSHQTHIFKRLAQRKIVYTTLHVLIGINNDTVTLKRLDTNDIVNRNDVNTLVYATANKACDELYESLKGKVKEVHVIGDAWAPREAYYATLHAFDITIEA